MSLLEILENLSVHCSITTGKRCDLKLVLPDIVIDEFSKSFKLVEKGVPVWSSDGNGIKSVYCSGGIIELIKESKNK